MINVVNRQRSLRQIAKSLCAIALSVALFLVDGLCFSNIALAQTNDAPATATPTSPSKPNIVVIWGDDIGQSDLSIFTKGMMGFKTPNIDRIAQEGILFTDYYGEQSCTAGRSAFITGQSVFRTGLSKVGLPGADSAILGEFVCSRMLQNGSFLNF